MSNDKCAQIRPTTPTLLFRSKEKLENLATELETTTEQLATTFADVLAPSTKGNMVGEEPQEQGSELGLFLWVQCDRISRQLNTIKGIIESSDI